VSVVLRSARSIYLFSKELLNKFFKDPLVVPCDPRYQAKTMKPGLKTFQLFFLSKLMAGNFENIFPSL